MFISQQTLKIALEATSKMADDLQSTIDKSDASEIILEERLSLLARAETELREVISDNDCTNRG